MRFLVDAQLPPALAQWLKERGHDAVAARDAGLRTAKDSAVWAYALQAASVVVTKDEDFAVRVLQAGSGPQVVWLRIGNCTNPTLFAWLEPLLPGIIQRLQAGDRLVEVKRGIS